MVSVQTLDSRSSFNSEILEARGQNPNNTNNFIIKNSSHSGAPSIEILITRRALRKIIKQAKAIKLLNLDDNLKNVPSQIDLSKYLKTIND